MALSARRMLIYSFALMRIAFDVYTVRAIFEHIYSGHTAQHHETIQSDPASHDANAGTVFGHIYSTFGAATSSHINKADSFNDLRNDNIYWFIYVLSFYFTPLWYVLHVWQWDLMSMLWSIVRMAIMGPDAATFVLGCNMGLDSGFGALMLWLGCACLAEKARDLYRRVEFIQNAIRFPVQYPLQLVQDDTIQWYQTTIRRSLASTIAFKPMLELPKTCVVFAANVYAVTLIPQLMYKMVMYRHHDNEHAFYWSSIVVFMLSLFPVVRKSFGRIFLLTGYLNMPLTQGNVFWLCMNVDVCFLRVAMLNGYHHHIVHAILLFVYGLLAWGSCVVAIVSEISMWSMLMYLEDPRFTQHLRESFRNGPGEGLSGDIKSLLQVKWRSLNRNQLAEHCRSVNEVLRRLNDEVELMCARLGNFGTDAAEYPEPAAECLGCAGAPPELEFTPCRHALFCESCFQKWKQVSTRDYKCPMCKLDVINVAYRRTYPRVLLSHEAYTRQGVDFTARELAKLYLYVHQNPAILSRLENQVRFRQELGMPSTS